MAYLSYSDMVRRTDPHSSLRLQLSGEASTFRKVEENLQEAEWRSTGGVHVLPGVEEREDDGESAGSGSTGASGWWERTLTVSSKTSSEGEESIWNDKDSNGYSFETPPSVRRTYEQPPVVSPHTLPPLTRPPSTPFVPRSVSHVSTSLNHARTPDPYSVCPYLAQLNNSIAPIPQHFQCLVKKDDPWFEALSIEKKAHYRAMVARMGWMIGTGNGRWGWELDMDKKAIHEFRRRGGLL